MNIQAVEQACRDIAEIAKDIGRLDEYAKTHASDAVAVALADSGVAAITSIIGIIQAELAYRTRSTHPEGAEQ